MQNRLRLFIDFLKFMIYNKFSYDFMKIIKREKGCMTNMRRVTIAIPESLDEKILELKKEDRFIRCSYGEIARRLLESGLPMLCAKTEEPERK